MASFEPLELFFSLIVSKISILKRNARLRCSLRSELQACFQLQSAPRPHFLLFPKFPSNSMQELPQYQVLRKYGQHASNFENYPKEILQNSAAMRKPGLPLTMMMAPGFEHELGFCVLHDKTWGPDDKNLPQSGTNDLIEQRLKKVKTAIFSLCC